MKHEKGFGCFMGPQVCSLMGSEERKGLGR